MKQPLLVLGGLVAIAVAMARLPQEQRARVSRVARTVARPVRQPLQVTIQVTLLGFLVGLLLVTGIALSGLWLQAMEDVIQRLEEEIFQTVAVSVASASQARLAPAEPILLERRAAALRGRLPVDQPEQLGEDLGERLRFEPQLAWLSYSDAVTGRFVGAWRRDDGAIILNQSSPEVDAGRPAELVLEPDGSRLPFTRDLPPGYDPRQRPWYQAALAGDGIVWTGPYRFNEGVPGFTAALAVRESVDGAPRGVLTADFTLHDIETFLSELPSSARISRRVFILSRQGQLLASSRAGGRVAPDASLPAAMAALPQPLAGLSLWQPLPFRFDDAGIRYAAAATVIPVAGSAEIAILVVVPEAEFRTLVDDRIQFSIVVGGGALLLAVAAAVLLARQFSRPLCAIAETLKQVSEFKLSGPPAPPSYIKEVAVVSTATEHMKASLRSFTHYVETDLVRELLASGEDARLGGEIRQLTIHFSDIQGYAGISEQMDPGSLVEHLGAYLDAMTAEIEAQGGTIDKFIGDAIVAFFNAPRLQPDHALRACRAALAEQRTLQQLQAPWQAAGKPAWHARIGLHMGDVLVGNIGTPRRFDYTAIGDAVNVASRLEGLNKLYGTRIMAGEALREATGDSFVWRRLDAVAMVGRLQGMVVSELLGEAGDVTPALLHACQLYEAALDAYLARNFAEAAAGFRASLAFRPGDTAAEVMARRADEFAQRPPPEGWDGVYHHDVK